MSSPVSVIKTQQYNSGFTEIVERGKGWLRSRNPVTGKLVLDASAGNRGWHRGVAPFSDTDEIDTDWQATTGTWDYEMTHADYQAYIDTAGNYRYEDYLTGEYVDLNVTFFGWTNDEGQSQQIPFNPVSPSVSGDILTWANLFGTGTAVRVQTQTGKLAKFIDVDNLTDLPAPTIGGTNIQLTFEYTLSHSNDIAVYIDGVLWDENGTMTSGNHVEFRQISTGNPVWWFMIPVAWDANNEEVTGSQTFKQAGANLFVDGHIPYSWIQTATYPITIDPTINPTVGASADDGHWRYNPDSFSNTANNMWMGSVNSTWLFNGFARFTGITIAGTIDDAYITYVAQSNQSGTTCNLTVGAEDADNPSAISSVADGESRVLTSATYAWNNLGAWTDGNSYSTGTGSLTASIQELVDTYTISNDAIQIIALNNSSSDGAVRSASTYDFSEPATLHIEYTTTISGEVTWGHDTGVTEANVRDFTGNWTGTGAITGSGDSERAELETTEYLISEVVNTGAYTVTLTQNKYGSGDSVDLDYRHGADQAACEAASWNNYTGPFTSLGYVQVRITSTL